MRRTCYVPRPDGAGPTPASWKLVRAVMWRREALLVDLFPELLNLDPKPAKD